MSRPLPGIDELLIEVVAAGVNRPDVAQRRGLYPPPPGASPVLGLEVAGRVAARGPGVTDWDEGDEVCALTPGGGYAEYCIAPAAHCLPVPRGLTLLEAASLPENWFTVWTNVIDRARLASGERILIHGGSSGIGLAAIQLARQFGAVVYATVGNAEKADYCRRAGAETVFIYREQDWVDELRKATDGRGVDVVLDMVGGDYTMKNLRSLAVDGRLVNIAFLNGSAVPDFDLSVITTRRLTLTGSTLRPRSIEDKTAIARALRGNVWPLFERKVLRPHVYETFPLSEARAAHELMESSRHIGKIMLRV